MLPFLCEKLSAIFLAPSCVTQAAAHLPGLSAVTLVLGHKQVRLQTRHICQKTVLLTDYMCPQADHPSTKNT